MIFAKLDESLTVVEVIIADQEFVNKIGGMWIPYAEDGSGVKNYPGIGYKFNIDLNAFVPEKTYNSWILNSDGSWEAPVARPNDEFKYIWNENQLSWMRVD